MSTNDLYPPGELAFTKEERQDILKYRQKRIARKRKREGPDMPEEIDMCLRRYYKNYDTVWKNLKPTGRCNEGVGILRLPVCGTEKEYRFVYRGSAMHTIPVTTHHSEASNMLKYEELEKAGVFLHSRPPKVYFVKYENDGNRGSKDRPAVICEYFDGCTDAEGKLRLDDEFGIDFEGNPKNRNEHADPDHSLYWSERKRKLYTRNHALTMIQMRLIQKSTISGGAENPMYDNMGSFTNMGPRHERGEDQAPNDRANLDRSADYFERGRAEEVGEHRFRPGHYTTEKEWACECLKRELAYWSTMHEETYLAMKDYTKQVLRYYTFRIDEWFTKSAIVDYLTKYLRHIETSPWTVDNHRFRDNENQFLGLFSMSHQDLYMGNNMMMKGDKPGFLLDFETSTFSNLSDSATHDLFRPTTYPNCALDPVAAGFATREQLVDRNFHRGLKDEYDRRGNPENCERKWPFSGDVAPFFDRYFRLTLFMQLERFDGRDGGEGLQFETRHGRHMTIPSVRRYLSEAFERFGPALDREDFNYGDRYDTSVDDVERPEAPDYSPGMFYDSDEDEDNMEELDLQPAYDRLRAERRYQYGTSAYRWRRAEEEEEEERADGEEPEEEPRVPGMSAKQREERENRYKHSPFAEDWMNNCSYPLTRRYLDDFVQNNPMAWFNDPATTFAGLPINHPVARNENFATFDDPWAEEEGQQYPRQTHEYFDAGYNNYGPDPQPGHPTDGEVLDINDTTWDARWRVPLEQFEARWPALNAAYRLHTRATDLPRDAPAANVPPGSTATLDAQNLAQWLRSIARNRGQ